jgi:hypothetical protein
VSDVPDGRPLLHVGYHKTGTTTLQLAYFTEAFGYGQLFGHDTVSERITECLDFGYDARAVAELAASRAAALKPGIVPVVSSEILSGNPHLGGRQARVYADRLAEAFPDARILITIREQKRMLASLYMQYLRRGGTKPVERYFDERPVTGYPTFSADNFCFDHLIGYYIGLFGRENVLVLTQEAMARDMRGYLTALNAFAGARSPTPIPDSLPRIGEGFPESGAWLFRRLNHFRNDSISDEPILDLLPDRVGRAIGMRAQKGPFRALLGDGRPVTDFVNRRFAGRFAESNRRLAALLGDTVDLSAYEA